MLTGGPYAALLALGNRRPLRHTASAQDDDDDDDLSFEQRVIKGILGGLGVNVGGAGIDYHERSPLVIPPSMDLPPPGSAAAAAARDPAWPKEPERKKVQKVVKKSKKPHGRHPRERCGTSSRLTAGRNAACGAKAGRWTDPHQHPSNSG